MFADLRRQRCLGVDHWDVFLVEDDVVDSALYPLIAFGLWNRSKVNAVLSNKVEHIVFDSISKMTTIRAEGLGHVGASRQHPKGMPSMSLLLTTQTCVQTKPWPMR